MEILLGYGAGLLTLINPCVLPILPIVLATALQSGRHGPLLVAAGMSVSFVALGMLVTVFGQALGITPEAVANAGAVMMVLFGLILLVPLFSEGFAMATAGVSARADGGFDRIDQSGGSGQFLGGMLLGAVWSPCIGPTLGGAIALASQGQSMWLAAGIMVSFALGVSTVIIALGYGARSAIQRRQAWMRSVASKAKPVMGVIFVAVGLGILFKVHHYFEYWAIQTLPAWLIDLSVSL
jgi:cytochrome c biogenesis protein CcdA